MSGFSGSSNIKVQRAYSLDLENKYKKVEKKADETIKSFATLIDELSKLSELSSGTEAKETVTKLTGELNNSSVFFTRMISDELSKLRGVITPDAEPALETQEV